jgi:3-oxoacyl-[acyl-carrier-protein] synthase-3
MPRAVITGSGCYIPDLIQSNADFTAYEFYDANSKRINTPNNQLIEKFEDITGITERRYTCSDMNASDMATIAARRAIEESGVDPETLDQIIVAHNFGNISTNTHQSHALPSLANQVKHQLGIENPACVAYDLIFGCAGWLQTVIHTDAFFRSGLAKKSLVIGTDTLSRVIDPHDRDAMIFADGAGACVLEYQQVDENGPGVLGCAAQSHSLEEATYIKMGRSNAPLSDESIQYLKMNGKKVYEYAIRYVPLAIKQCLDQCGVDISDVKKIFIHQANEKMDDRIIQLLYELYGTTPPPTSVMPMSIQWLGNSSVATIPTLYDLVRKNQVEGHHLSPGDLIVFAAVGAGMNLNAVCYRY